jgi:hypothetical protein
MEAQVKQAPKIPGKPHISSYDRNVAKALADVESVVRPKPRRTNEVSRWLMVAAGLALMALGGRFVVWTAHRVDRQMRDEIFLQAQMVAQAVDFENVAALSGTEADLDSPDYRRLKEQLSLIRKANPKCRFIYLMGRRADGKIFFYVDSEDPDSPDYSPPGETYDEATKDDYAVFTTGTGNVNGGPYKDRWGVWISAMVPVIHPDTRKMLAVLGMDFNAASWKWDVASRTTLPASSSVLAFLLGLYILAVPVRVAWR